MAQLAWTGLSLSCTTQGESGARASCRLEAAIEVAHASATRFDDIAAAPTRDGALAVWSEPTGTYGQNLDASARTRGPVVRITERCSGGLDLAAAPVTASAQGDGSWLACSRPHTDPEQAELMLLRLNAAGQVETKERIGRVGRDGAGVSIALDGKHLFIAWHDGTVGAYAARLMIATEDKRAYLTLSDPTFAAGAPSVAARNGHWLAAFSETRIGLEHTATRVMLRSDREPARMLCETDVSDSAPIVGWDDASPWIAYRDRRAKNAKPELYTMRLSTKLTPSGSSHSVGRANGEGTPSLVTCGQTRVALLPRDYASERYIGVHALDAAFQNLESGHQYYANSRDFVLATAVCTGGSALVFASERTAPAKPGASLMSMSFHCDPGGAGHSGVNAPSVKR